MKWTMYCNSLSLLDPWEKCGLFGLSLGVRPMESTQSSSLSGCLASVEDERLYKCVISGDSATRAEPQYKYTLSLLCSCFVLRSTCLLLILGFGHDLLVHKLLLQTSDGIGSTLP